MAHFMDFGPKTHFDGTAGLCTIAAKFGLTVRHGSDVQGRPGPSDPSIEGGKVRTSSTIRRYLRAALLAGTGVIAFGTSVEQARAQGCQPPPSNMVFWYANDGTDAELIGNLPATRSGSVADVPGRFDVGTEIQRGAGVSFADTPTLDMGTRSFSIDAWIKTSESGTVPIVDKRTGAQSSQTTGYFLFLTGGRLGLQLGDGTFRNVIGGPSINDGDWHHVAATVDRRGRLVTLWVDGTQVHQSSHMPPPGANIDNSAALRIGQGYFSESARMVVDEVEIFTRLLTSQEIASLARAPKCKQTAAPQGRGDLIVNKEPVDPQSPQVGGPVAFTIQVEASASGGPVTWQPGEIVVYDPPLPAFTNLSLSGNGWNCSSSTPRCTNANAVTAAAGQTIALPPISVQAVATQAGRRENCAQVGIPGPAIEPISGQGKDADGGNSYDCGTVTIGTPAQPEVSIEKTAVGSNWLVNSAQTYQIDVTLSAAGGPASWNPGEISVSDALPPGMTLVEVKGLGWNCPGNAFPCTNQNNIAIATGSNAVLTLYTTVTPGQAGQFSNCATVTSPHDGNAGNNESCTPVVVVDPPVDPCCAPISSSEAIQLFYFPGFAPGQPFDMVFNPPPALLSQMQAYINYMAAISSATRVVVTFSAFDHGSTQPSAPGAGGSLVSQHDVSWQAGGSPPTSFNFFPNKFQGQRWYSVTAAVFLEDAQGNRSPVECEVKGFRLNNSAVSFRTANRGVPAQRTRFLVGGTRGAPIETAPRTRRYRY